MPLILGANTTDPVYEISNSLRFEESSDEYLYWLPTSNPTGGGQTFTFSFWYKPTASYATNQMIFGNADDDSDTRYGQIRHRTGASGALEFSFGDNQDGGWKFDLETSALLRDPAAWYHIICQSDTTNSTEGDRIKIYINGERVTSFGTENYPAQNYVSDFGANDIEQTVGGTRDTEGNYSAPFSGYLSDVYFIDGQALTPTSFGKTNTNGVWIPKKFSGSFGTNGYKLEFQQTGTSANSSGMGADTSGNDHHFTVVALDATSVTTDTPTNNFATLNPLSNSLQASYSEGNLNEACNDNYGVGATQAFANGKWYWEVKITAGDNNLVGIANSDEQHRFTTTFGINNYSITAYGVNGHIFREGSTVETSGVTYGANDIVGLAVDMDSGTRTVQFYKNGSSFGNAVTLPTNWGFTLPIIRKGGSSQTSSFNFGNPAFSISSSNSDANGYGSFEYSVPNGYFALCTKNLAEYG